MPADTIDLVRSDPLSAVSTADLAASAASAIQTARLAETAGDVFEQLERRRIEGALSRLDELYEPIRRRRDLLDVGLSRINGLRATMVAQLDAITPDADLEPNGDEEPSLGFPEPGLRVSENSSYWVLSQERLHACLPLDHGDREEEDEHDEASLCGINFGAGDMQDREDEHDGREPDVDDEPSLCGSVGSPWQHAVGGQWRTSDRQPIDLEDQCDDEGHDSDREPAEHD